MESEGMNSKLRVAAISAAFLIWGASSGRVAHAAPQRQGCSLLTPAQIQKVVGQPFSAPIMTAAPPAFAKQSWGSNCRYSSQDGEHVLVSLIVYMDESPAEAKQTFDKLSLWYAAKSKPAVGDSAYIDSHGAIHGLTGKVRYYISLDPQNEKQLKDLAASVAAMISQ
jgi:hypothetical protein